MKQKRSRGRTGSRWEKARRRVLRASQICWLCGELIDTSLKWPDPMSASVDHEIPVSRLEWDDPRLYDVQYLHPAHLICNQKRSDLRRKKVEHPQSRKWLN